MNNILIVPDVHGRLFWEPVLNFKGEIIFLGDYADPYPHEKITLKQAYENFLRIVDFKKENEERVTLLIGNHELHYYDKAYTCSRFSSSYYKRYKRILTNKDTAHLFQLCKQMGNYFFVHAGILKEWYDRHLPNFTHLGVTLEEQLNNYFKVNKDAYSEVSAVYRGGDYLAGSPVWADIREYIFEEEHFNNQLVQIVGHTLIENDEPFMKDNIILLDNMKLYLLKADRIEIYKNQLADNNSPFSNNE